MSTRPFYRTEHEKYILVFAMSFITKMYYCRVLPFYGMFIQVQLLNIYLARKSCCHVILPMKGLFMVLRLLKISLLALFLNFFEFRSIALFQNVFACPDSLRMILKRETQAYID